MRKIMFSKRYGLEQAVLEELKTMTRRVVPESTIRMAEMEVRVHGGDLKERIREHAPVFPGETMAIAQAYRDLPYQYQLPPILRTEKGWTNKMYVRAELMPERIYITNLKIEQLQDISDEDCMKEGILEGEFMNTWDRFYYDQWGDVANHITFKKPREAFAALIDKVSRKKVWEKNPWVFAYEFELLK